MIRIATAVILMLLALGCGAPVVQGELCDVEGASTCGPASVRYDCRCGRWQASTCVACREDATGLYCTVR